MREEGENGGGGDRGTWDILPATCTLPATCHVLLPLPACTAAYLPAHLLLLPIFAHTTTTMPPAPTAHTAPPGVHPFTPFTHIYALMCDDE